MPEGVYLSVTGPSFETPAEIRAFRTMGADLVGDVPLFTKSSWRAIWALKF